jgi:hypothetical protein
MATGARGRTQTEERSLGELFTQLTENLRNLVRREIELARIETKEQISKATKGAGMFAGTGVAALLALILLSFAAAWGLAEVMPVGLAFLVVGLVYAAVAGVLFVQGRQKLANLNPVPQQTMETVKQDVQVARESFAEGASAEGSSGPSTSWAANDSDGNSRRR